MDSKMFTAKLDKLSFKKAIGIEDLRFLDIKSATKSNLGIIPENLTCAHVSDGSKRNTTFLFDDFGLQNIAVNDILVLDESDECNLLFFEPKLEKISERIITENIATFGIDYYVALEQYLKGQIELFSHLERFAKNQAEKCLRDIQHSEQIGIPSNENMDSTEADHKHYTKLAAKSKFYLGVLDRHIAAAKRKMNPDNFAETYALAREEMIRRHEAYQNMTETHAEKS